MDREHSQDSSAGGGLTPTTFRASLSALGLTIGGFARLVGVSRVTCANWGGVRARRGVQAFPEWVPLLLEAWRRHPDLLA
jgi:hypothetical protein